MGFTADVQAKLDRARRWRRFGFLCPVCLTPDQHNGGRTRGPETGRPYCATCRREMAPPVTVIRALEAALRWAGAA